MSTNDVVLLEVDEVLLEVDVNVVMKSFSPPSRGPRRKSWHSSSLLEVALLRDVVVLRDVVFLEVRSV